MRLPLGISVKFPSFAAGILTEVSKPLKTAALHPRSSPCAPKLVPSASPDVPSSHLCSVCKPLDSAAFRLMLQTG